MKLTNKEIEQLKKNNIASIRRSGKGRILVLLLRKPRNNGEIGDKLNMSAPLVCYHVYGNAKNEGLGSLGLIKLLHYGNKQTRWTLTRLGKVFANSFAKIKVKK